MKTAKLFSFALLALTCALPTFATSQENQSLFGKRTLSVTYGPYARLELGGASPSLSGGTWLPPGASDPSISFDVIPDESQLGFGAMAIGYDWQNGFRADLSVFGTASTGLTAPCSSASDGSACSTHADITGGSLQTRGMMVNAFYAPLEARGSNNIFQPFIVGGIGLAQNDVGDWTRTKNPNNATLGNQDVKDFFGDKTTSIAWSAGVGASLQLTKAGQWPVLLEASWRYYDFGTAKGSSTLKTGSGGMPREPFSFENTSQVVSIGVRISLERY